MYFITDIAKTKKYMTFIECQVLPDNVIGVLILTTLKILINILIFFANDEIKVQKV